MTRDPLSLLLSEKAPHVLTTSQVRTILIGDDGDPPSNQRVFNWLRKNLDNGVLRQVTKGIYINQLAQPRPQIAEAAYLLRRGAMVSLQTVLGDAGVTNNYSDVVTSVIPYEMESTTRPVQANDAEFWFRAMPLRLLDERAGSLEDRYDLDVIYPRATPEKALLDWIYLGSSPRSSMTRPPLDMDLGVLKMARLKRLAKAMKITDHLDVWLEAKADYDVDPEVDANAAIEDIGPGV